MTDDATAADPIFSAAEVKAFEEDDKGVGKAIGVMLAILFSLFVPLMLSFWLGVGTTTSASSKDEGGDETRVKVDDGAHGKAGHETPPKPN